MSEGQYYQRANESMYKRNEFPATEYVEYLVEKENNYPAESAR